jgi:hypothetical protein
MHRMGVFCKKTSGVFLYGKYNGQVGEWLKPGDCKSPASGYVGSNPTLSTKIWADSDNGSTGRLQRFSRGSIPRRSTKILRSRCRRLNTWS